VFNVIFGASVIAVKARQSEVEIPVWIIAFNFTAMLFQIIYYLFSY
jgi:hypothetical protein